MFSLVREEKRLLALVDEIVAAHKQIARFLERQRACWSLFGLVPLLPAGLALAHVDHA